MKRQLICRRPPAFKRTHGRRSIKQSSLQSAVLMLLAAAAVGLGGCSGSLNDNAPGAMAAQKGPAGAGLTPAAGAGNPMPMTAVAASAPGAQLAGPLATPAVANASTPSAQLANVANDISASSKPGSTAYKIGPLDVLDVSVFKVPDLSKTVQVADSGTVNLPLVGEVPAAGLTAQEVERDLTKRLGAKYLQSPQVTVFVKEYNSQRVTIEGAVKKPGVYPIRGRASLLQLIATAEGVTETAENDVAIFRETGGKRSAAKFNLADIRSGSAEDPPLQQGDTVVINNSAFATGYQNLLKALPIGSFIALL